jgi:hypothetical protein
MIGVASRVLYLDISIIYQSDWCVPNRLWLISYRASLKRATEDRIWRQRLPLIKRANRPLHDRQEERLGCSRHAKRPPQIPSSNGNPHDANEMIIMHGHGVTGG